MPARWVLTGWVLTTEPEDLSSSPRTHMVKGKNQDKQTHTHHIINFLNNVFISKWLGISLPFKP